MDCFKAMSFAAHATLELKQLNYDTFWIENAPYIPSTFDGDVFFELPCVDNPNGHLHWMQKTNRKYDNHF
jgi:hypothetical protein